MAPQPEGPLTARKHGQHNVRPLALGPDGELPPQLSRVKRMTTLHRTWRRMQESVCTPDVLHGMPKAIEHIAQTLYEVQPHMVIEAVKFGDPALLVAVLIRLNQIDATLIAMGRSKAERSPVIYAKHVVDGFRLAAEERYTQYGGAPLPD